MEENLQQINACRPDPTTYKPIVKPQDLTVGTAYTAKRIRRVATKYGEGYVVESSEFQMFLPKHYLKVKILEYMEQRRFTLMNFDPTPNGKLMPVFNFHF
jgi:hypothetical protein